MYRNVPINPPQAKELEQISNKYNLRITPEDMEEYKMLITGLLESYNEIDRIHSTHNFSQSSVQKYARNFGRRPTADENPHNAISWLCNIKGANEGKLANRKIVIKDNVAIAGIPMMNGSRTLETYIADDDATIIGRLLDAGVTIIGKSVCEDLCLSGSSFTSFTGPVLNPNDITRATGGSSSGSAALVASGFCDIAIGGDQGGSLRIPPSWCGVVGLKPTWGLVPYSGIFPLEKTIDHAGPITKTVRDAALILDVIAGPDGLDGRQINVSIPSEGYLSATDSVDVSNMRIAILKEGVDLCEPEIQKVFKDAVDFISNTLKCSVIDEVSIEMHKTAPHIWNGIGFEGIHSLVIENASQGNNAKGYYSPQLAQQFSQGLQMNAPVLSATNKLVMLTGEYVKSQTHGKYYGMAQNLGKLLTAEYDRVLSQYDVIIMPTLPKRATKIPLKEEYSVTKAVDSALNMIANTVAANVTGHPAITVDCRISDEEKNNLPVGLMIVGKHWDERSILRLAHSFSTQI